MEWSRWFWAALLGYLCGCVLWRRSRQWLSYYLWSCAGLAILLINVGLASGLHDQVVRIEMQHVQSSVQRWIETRPLGVDKLMISDPTGWSILLIGTECSALLEIACLLGLVIFYPRIEPTRRLYMVIAGMGATYALNIGRLVIIVLMTHYLGKQFVMVAHTIVGRLFFFTGTILAYWHLIKRPTIALVARDVRERMS